VQPLGRAPAAGHPSLLWVLDLGKSVAATPASGEPPVGDRTKSAFPRVGDSRTFGSMSVVLYDTIRERGLRAPARSLQMQRDDATECPLAGYSARPGARNGRVDGEAAPGMGRANGCRSALPHAHIQQMQDRGACTARLLRLGSRAFGICRSAHRWQEWAAGGAPGTPGLAGGAGEHGDGQCKKNVLGRPRPETNHIGGS
jgi:hypothetical protein